MLTPVALINKIIFDNTLVKLHKFTTNSALELHNYDKVTSKLEDDIQFGSIGNTSSGTSITQRNLDTSYLVDVGEIDKLSPDITDSFTNIRWISSEEAKGLNIEEVDKQLLNKAINPDLDLKLAIDNTLDHELYGANQLLNKLLVNDKKGLIQLLDEGYNINALNPDGINVTLLAAYRDDCKDLLKTLIEKYGADINLQTTGMYCGKDYAGRNHKLLGASSALEVAILKDDLELAKYLINKGTEIRVDRLGASVQHSDIMKAYKMAQETGKLEMLDLLFAQGISISGLPFVYELIYEKYPKK